MPDSESAGSHLVGSPRYRPGPSQPYPRPGAPRPHPMGRSSLGFLPELCPPAPGHLPSGTDLQAGARPGPRPPPPKPGRAAGHWAGWGPVQACWSRTGTCPVSPRDRLRAAPPSGRVTLQGLRNEAVPGLRPGSHHCRAPGRQSPRGSRHVYFCKVGLSLASVSDAGEGGGCECLTRVLGRPRGRARCPA